MIAFIYVLPYALVVIVILVIVLFATRKKRAELKTRKKAAKNKPKKEGQNNEYNGPQYDEEDKQL